MLNLYSIMYQLKTKLLKEPNCPQNLIYLLLLYKIQSIRGYRMDNCTLDCIQLVGHLNNTEMCEFTKTYCIQDTVDFIQAYYCMFNSSFLILVFIGIPLLLLLLKTLNVVAEHYISPCVEVCIEEFKISPILAGVTFLAFANGAPDVMTAIIAGSSDSSTTALIPFGSIFGACLFSTAYILSVVIFSQPNQTLQIKRKQIVAPVAFYIFGIAFIILISLIYGKMNIYISCSLLFVYIIFICYVVKSQHKQKKHQSLLQSENQQPIQLENEQNQQKNQVSINKQNPKQQRILHKINNVIVRVQNIILVKIIPPYSLKDWNSVNAICSLVVSPFILALTQDIGAVFRSFVVPIPVFIIICIPAICLLVYTIFCIVRDQQPQFPKVFAIYSFLVSVAALTVLCSILINLIQLLQLLTDMNPVFLGLTVLAWANSIGDYLTIVYFAKNNNPKTAVAGIFSGQLFNFFLGFSISLLIQSIDGQYEYRIFDFAGSTYDKISDAIVMIVILAGFFYLVYTLVIVIKNRGVLMKKQGRTARFYYIGFLIVACLLALTTDFFHEIQCVLC